MQRSECRNTHQRHGPAHGKQTHVVDPSVAPVALLPTEPDAIMCARSFTICDASASVTSCCCSSCLQRRNTDTDAHTHT